MRGIVGTAGHIDHGKTALIQALTGEHTDRLPEEKERGISIDLGFTHLDTDHGVFGVVDVPGHEDFIRNMLAGATGIDVLLLVVAADEGVMPQTREHVAIAELLGVPRAVVALSKVDLVDDEWLGLVHDELADFLAGTPFAGAPVVPTSATEPRGIAEIRAAIEEIFAGTRGRADDLFRLPVDRTFTVRGTGTVVTGTVWSGRLDRDQAVRLLPGGLDARVRSLQVHGGDVDSVEAGQRAAIALAGVDRDAIERGTAVVRGPGWEETTRITATLRVLPGVRWRVEGWQRVRVHLGTAEVMARTVLLDSDRLDPGTSGFVQLRLEAPVVARAGDRFVVRSYSPVTTIGGGVVLEPMAPRRTRLEPEGTRLWTGLASDEPEARLAGVLDDAAAQGVEADSLPVRCGAPPGTVNALLEEMDATKVGDRVFEVGAAHEVRDRIVDIVEEHHREAPLQPGIDPERLRRRAGEGAAEELVEAVLADLLDQGRLVSRRGRIARAGFEPELTQEHEELRARIRQVIARGGLAPPRLDALQEELEAGEVVTRLVELLAADGEVTRIEHDLFVDSGILEAAAENVRRRLGGRQGVSPGDFREVLEVSRRHLIPLLEYFDRVGLTARTGEGRAVAD